MGVLDVVRSWLADPWGTTKAAQTVAPYARVMRARMVNNDPRRGSKMLRNFADQNEWVRIAVNRRKRQIGQAKWHIVRIDDPKKSPDPRVVKQVTELFRYVNQKRESFRSLMDQVIEDLLVLDAGCIEKEKTFAGQIVALHAVDGASIVVDPKWDGSSQNAPRYRQFVDFQLVAELTNDEMIYMMANPTTHRPIGWSPVETLVRVIEAELYGEQYDYEALRQTAPEGILDLGRGVPPDQVDAFREYYEAEIAGTKSLAIFGGGSEAGVGGQVKFTPFKYSNREQQRQEYKTWLAKKIASVFEMDPTLFGITGDVNRSTSKTMKQSTDEGHVGLATLVQEFVTREIVWEIDEDHGFEFADVVPRDEGIQADIDVKYMGIGVTTPNEIRAREGLDPVPWGDVPYSAPNVSASYADPEEDPEPENDPEPQPEKPSDGEDEADKGVATSAAPFVVASLRTRAAKLRYLDISDT